MLVLFIVIQSDLTWIDGPTNAPLQVGAFRTGHRRQHRPAGLTPTLAAVTDKADQTGQQGIRLYSWHGVGTHQQAGIGMGSGGGADANQ